MIARNWSEVSLKDYLKFYTAFKPYEDSEISNDNILSLWMFHIAGVSSAELRGIPKPRITQYTNEVNALYESAKTLPLVKTFKLDGKEWGFIPDLENMSYGEYLDLVTYSQSTWENIPLIMSILYRPITYKNGQTYSIQEYAGTVDSQVQLFANELGMDIVWGAISFFFHLLRELLKDSLLSSLKETKKILSTDSQLKEDLHKNGALIEHSLHLLEETLSK
jgi:hypothetical protein